MVYYLWKMKVKENTKPERIIKMSKAELENIMRKEIIEVIRAALSEHFDLDPIKQIENVSASEITVPLVDMEGNEKYPIIKVSIPRGKRNGSGGYIPYDGHAAAEEYALELEDRQAKKIASAEKKAQDEKLRAQRREARQTKKAITNLEKAVKKLEEDRGE